MSVNIRENGQLKKAAGKIPGSFATFNADHFALKGSNKEMNLADSVVERLEEVDKQEETIDNSADWLKSKNLFDKTIVHLTTIDGVTIASYVEPLETLAVIKVEPNKTYTISKALSNRCGWAFTPTFPKLNDPINGFGIDNTLTEKTVTVPSNNYYMLVFIHFNDGSSPITAEQAINSLQVEEGENATPYQPFTKSNVELANNISNIYDEWINGSAYAIGSYAIYNNTLYKCVGDGGGNTIPGSNPNIWIRTKIADEISALNNNIESIGKYSKTDEVRIGTWINGKPLYHKTFEFSAPTSANINVDVLGFTELGAEDYFIENGFILNNGARLEPTFFYNTTNYASTIVQNGHVYMFVTSQYVGKSVTLTLAYTKA